MKDNPLGTIRYAAIETVSSNLIHLRMKSFVDDSILDFRITREYARKFAEDLIKTCDEMEKL